MEFLHTAFHFFRHWLFEINDHSLHSPYLFDFYVHVIRAARKIDSDPGIEALRKNFRHDHRKIRTGGLGAGSRTHQKKPVRISEIVRTGLTSTRYSKLLLAIINYYQCRTVVELGTSLGLNTLYLSRGNQVKTIFTFEGNPGLTEITKEMMNTRSDKDIKLIQGDIDQTLMISLKQLGKIDFVYLDANHTKEATLRYFSQIRPFLSDRSILVFDDIYWSQEMTEAWKMICRLSQKNLCLDLFRVGILILDKNAPDGYFRLAF